MKGVKTEMVAIFQEIKAAINPMSSCTKYDSAPYKGTELEKTYKKGYFDGLASSPKAVLWTAFNAEQRAAYAHGYLTGAEELWNADD